MASLKEELVQYINEMPETNTIEDVMYRLYVIDKIRKGKACIDQSDLVSLTDLTHETETW